jgi:hypothetical protein
MAWLLAWLVLVLRVIYGRAYIGAVLFWDVHSPTATIVCQLGNSWVLYGYSMLMRNAW